MSFGDGGVVRLQSSFDPDCPDLRELNALALRGDGTTFLAGTARSPTEFSRLALVKLTREGRLDGSFDADGVNVMRVGRPRKASGAPASGSRPWARCAGRSTTWRSTGADGSCSATTAWCA